MKSYEVPAWLALLSVSLLAGCAGTSSIGSGSGGEAGVVLGMGGSDTAAEGGAAGTSLACQTADDCRALSDAPCTPCLDDNKCAVPACLGNACQLVCVVP